MDVVKAAEMNGEKAEEKRNAEQKDEDERGNSTWIAAQHRAIAPGNLCELRCRLNDHPDDGAVANDEAREPERPNQITRAPARPPGNGKTNRESDSVRPAARPAFGVRFSGRLGEEIHSTLSTRATESRNTSNRRVYYKR